MSLSVSTEVVLVYSLSVVCSYQGHAIKKSKRTEREGGMGDVRG